MATLADNKKALFDYEILQTHQAGLALFGFEVKAILAGRVNLRGAFVIIRGNEAFLVNADIAPYQANNTPAGYEQSRTRKLLLKKKEIAELGGKVSQHGLTLIPISLYTVRHKIKLSFGLAKSRKKFEKREHIKERDFKRQRQRILKT
ncbi:SsrA-binding protein [Candidatus Azambacteria bacterium RIFCSPHIGHO2_02_FULL_52_12]|uniref:SsrA-binding protein n=1 Tax=Candidatus Azambacteria bacterium RIFCSPLOWO2_01_FULL_46_25 TaxID=1797298 RepID=A0A1F5BUX1_9BACT|nr:MAG: SsrA-binding protein [Candidatus Azambacteria bacterium RIFCSPHIGHO2_02_FULL_52_12]OGD34425.1 MAG: SsrA-binding protein [Candidatus Azambacteria bacterium RIFCSPLOWO2_01_FULL_46_25]OGD37297.1 MAG: SsrA-binding protein [Candidatus Azambacteria bacterium RIFCSPHIGHO2_01_FULL_51_74]